MSDDRGLRFRNSIGDSLLPGQIPRPPPVVPSDRSRWATPGNAVDRLVQEPLIEPFRRDSAARDPLSPLQFRRGVAPDSIQTVRLGSVGTVPSLVFGSTGRSL